MDWLFPIMVWISGKILRWIGLFNCLRLMINYHEQWWICVRYHGVSYFTHAAKHQQWQIDTPKWWGNKKQGSSRVEVSKRSTNENYKKAYCVQLSPPQCHQRPNLFRFSHRSWHLHPRGAQRWNLNRTKTSLKIQDSFRRLTPAFSVKLLKIKWPFWSYMKACDSHTCLESQIAHPIHPNLQESTSKTLEENPGFGMICENQPSFC